MKKVYMYHAISRTKRLYKELEFSTSPFLPTTQLIPLSKMKAVFLALLTLFSFALANEKMMMVNGKKYVYPQDCIQSTNGNTLRIQNQLDGPRINVYKDNHCQKLVNQVYEDQSSTVRGQSVKVDYSARPH